MILEIAYYYSYFEFRSDPLRLYASYVSAQRRVLLPELDGSRFQPLIILKISSGFWFNGGDIFGFVDNWNWYCVEKEGRDVMEVKFRKYVQKDSDKTNRNHLRYWINGSFWYWSVVWNKDCKVDHALHREQYLCRYQVSSYFIVQLLWVWSLCQGMKLLVSCTFCC